MAKKSFRNSSVSTNTETSILSNLKIELKLFTEVVYNTRDKLTTFSNLINMEKVSCTIQRTNSSRVYSTSIRELHREFLWTRMIGGRQDHKNI